MRRSLNGKMVDLVRSGRRPASLAKEVRADGLDDRAVGAAGEARYGQGRWRADDAGGAKSWRGCAVRTAS